VVVHIRQNDVNGKLTLPYPTLPRHCTTHRRYVRSALRVPEFLLLYPHLEYLGSIAIDPSLLTATQLSPQRGPRIHDRQTNYEGCRHLNHCHRPTPQQSVQTLPQSPELIRPVQRRRHRAPNQRPFPNVSQPPRPIELDVAAPIASSMDHQETNPPVPVPSLTDPVHSLRGTLHS
jgi:hypothetical protein